MNMLKSWFGRVLYAWSNGNFGRRGFYISIGFHAGLAVAMVVSVFLRPIELPNIAKATISTNNFENRLLPLSLRIYHKVKNVSYGSHRHALRKSIRKKNLFLRRADGPVTVYSKIPLHSFVPVEILSVTENLKIVNSIDNHSDGFMSSDAKNSELLVKMLRDFRENVKVNSGSFTAALDIGSDGKILLCFVSDEQVNDVIRYFGCQAMVQAIFQSAVMPQGLNPTHIAFESLEWTESSFKITSNTSTVSIDSKDNVTSVFMDTSPQHVTIMNSHVVEDVFPK